MQIQLRVHLPSSTALRGTRENVDTDRRYEYQFVGITWNSKRYWARPNMNNIIFEFRFTLECTLEPGRRKMLYLRPTNSSLIQTWLIIEYDFWTDSKYQVYPKGDGTVNTIPFLPDVCTFSHLHGIHSRIYLIQRCKSKKNESQTTTEQQKDGERWRERWKGQENQPLCRELGSTGILYVLVPDILGIFSLT